MEEIVSKIRLYGDCILRKKTSDVVHPAERHRKILSEMAQIMYEVKGVGLAASQVGLDESLAVIDIGSGLYKLINPKIVRKQGSQVMEEGCLSIPGINIKVKRAKKVEVEAYDEFGKPVKIEAEGLLASVFQHEVDHLKGKLIIDYASLFDKLKLKIRLAELKKRQKSEELSESETKS